MATCRYTESRSLDAVRLRRCSQTDWTCTSRPRPDRTTGNAAYVFERNIFPLRSSVDCYVANTYVVPTTAGPLPKFTGISVDASERPPSASPPPSAGGTGPVRVPPLNPEDVNKFSGLFDKSDTQNGLISGTDRDSICAHSSTYIANLITCFRRYRETNFRARAFTERGLGQNLESFRHKTKRGPG